MIKPEISISLITYNRKDLLRLTLQSLERQTLSKDLFEVVIIDDGSSDGTPLVMEDIAKNSPCQARCLRQDANRGKAAVRNISIANARGRLVLFLEDDTVTDQHLLEEHLMSHKLYPSEEIAILGREVRARESIVSPIGKYIETTSQNFFRNIISLIESNDPDSYRGFITFNLSMKKSFLQKNGMFDPEFRYFSEDIELGYRLFTKGLKIKYNENAIIYNNHPASLLQYCSRNYNRGYFQYGLMRKHPTVFNTSLPANRSKKAAKDLVYPPLMKMIDAIDRYLLIPMPGRLYQRIMDYYIERGLCQASKDEKAYDQNLCQ